MYLNPHIGRWWSIVGTPSLKWTPFVTKKRNPKQKKNHREKKLWLSKIFVRPLLKKYIAKIKTDITAFEQEKLKYFYEIMFPLKKKDGCWMRYCKSFNEKCTFYERNVFLLMRATVRFLRKNFCWLVTARKKRNCRRKAWQFLNSQIDVFGKNGSCAHP